MRSFFDSDILKKLVENELDSSLDKLTPEQKIEACAQQIIKALGLNKDSEELLETPFRIAKMYYKELFSSINKEPDVKLTSFKSNYEHYITMTGIPYYSVCSHHFMPFFGTVDIAYFPKNEDSKVLGLSKFPRLVKFFSRKPQVQEDFTQELAKYIYEQLKPEGVLIRVTGYHTCVASRGAEVEAKVTTEAMLGNIDKNEVLHLWKA
ncbi:MAG: GTP cyclohydrolase I FolE [Spirochaetia bacterium]|nr:GTP cyclohydrolase I FolE [Spirochaetia bacterium]